MNNNKLILHAVIMHKPFFKTKEQALNKAIEMFPNELGEKVLTFSSTRLSEKSKDFLDNKHIKGFVRETGESFRVRVIPKTQFDETTHTKYEFLPQNVKHSDETSYISKVLNDNITIVLGKLKNAPPAPQMPTQTKIHRVDFDKLQKYKLKYQGD